MSEVWFGTKAHMQWVSAPAVDVQAGKQGYRSQVEFTNGGTWVRRSKASYRRYMFAWNMRTIDEVQPVIDYADGIYGDGYVYYLNPFWSDRNALPAYWAAPFINAYDGPLIVDGIRPNILNANTSNNGYPVESAVYTLTSTSKIPYVFVPIPPGYTAYVGAHGELLSGNATVRVIPELSAIASGTPVDLTLLGTSTNERTNASFPGGTNIGITITMNSTSSGSLSLSGLIVQVLPDGVLPSTGGFQSGQGQSGMSFLSQPTVSEYSAYFGRVGVSAELAETEAWAWR